MLQKSRSKSIAKFKFLIIVPLLLVMLTYVACSEDREEINEKQSLSELSEQINKLEIRIEESEDITEEEREILMKLAIKMNEKINENSDYPPTPPSPPSPTRNVEAGSDVPFAVIDEVPVFPGCEELTSNNERKECMTAKITDFVSSNFKTGLGKELGLTGINRVIVQFKIDETGKVVDVKSRAPHPDLEVEAKRVISALPQMQPGKQKGKEVGVMYSLPIVFEVDE